MTSFFPTDTSEPHGTTPETLAVKPFSQNSESLPPIGQMIDELAVIRDRRREIAEEDKELSKAYTALENNIIERLDLEHTPKSSGQTASASISESDFPGIADFDQFVEYVRENDAFYLFQRRVSSSAINDLRKAGEEIPGIKIYTKRSLNLRKTR